MTPEFGAEPLTLPFQVRFRFYWSPMVRSTVLAIAVGVQLIFLVPAFFAIPSAKDIPLWAFWLFIEALAVAFVTFAVTMASATSRSRLLVNEDGITTWDTINKHAVTWGKARLFTILPNGDYELVSPTDKVVLHPIADFKESSQQPDIPFDEYHRKMNGLLLLISERTNLPLTDLRDVKGG